MALDKDGYEVLDNRPLSRPVGWSTPLSLQDQIRMFVRRELSQQAGNVGSETFEEADDFDCDDDPELKSPYEVDEDLPRWDDKSARAQAIREAEERFLDRVNPEKKISQGGGENGGKPE